MSVTHIVMFRFEEAAAPSEIQAACQRFLALQNECLHPDTQKPYLRAVSGGKDNSPEGNQGGITHIFVVEFASAEDRDYYVGSDAAHKRFVESLSGLVAKAQVVDFTSNAF